MVNENGEPKLWQKNKNSRESKIFWKPKLWRFKILGN